MRSTPRTKALQILIVALVAFAAPSMVPIDVSAEVLIDPLLDLDDLVGLDDGFEQDLLDADALDPYEPANRGVFIFNEGFYQYVVHPVGTGVEGIFPTVVRRSFGNFFSNLSEPVIFVNDLLQLSPRNALRSGGRFVVNSTVGVLGLFDAAEHFGVRRHESDFGQTLGVYRVRSGPYLVLPLLGPTTVRDSLGTLVDFAFRPDLWLLGLGPALALFGGDVWFTYDVERERLAALRQTSVDFYAALRGAYLMDRLAAVEARRLQLAR